MTAIHHFPQQYSLICEYVDAIYSPSPTLDELGNEDVFVRLKDGRELGFTVFTLVNIQQLMHQEALTAFVSPGMLVVTRVTWEAIFSAIEECLRLSIGDGPLLERFGVLQAKAQEE